MAARLKAMGSPKYQTDGEPPTSGPGFGIAVHDHVLSQPLRWKKPRIVFVDSMSDLFHPSVPEEFIVDVFGVMEDTPHHTYQVLTKRSKRLTKLADRLRWPPNVWMGVSVETEKYLFRVDHLRQVSAAVRFVSAEPLLGPLTNLNLADIDWVIAGGESGHKARPIQKEWVRDIRDLCAEHDVPFFFKQWGGRTPKANGRHLDGELHNATPATLPF